MDVAVTGGTGCLGTPLIDKLVSAQACLKLLSLPNDPNITYTNNSVKTITGDLNSKDALDMLCQNCDAVFHLAGRVHSVPGTEKEELEFYKVNVDGTQNLLDAAKRNKVKRVIFYSTVGVYGRDADFHGDEMSPCNPISAYAKSKYLAEQLVLKSSINGGPDGVVLRFPVVYGPLDKGNIVKLIKAVQNRVFFFFGDGNSLRSMISSKNAAAAAIKACFEPKAANELFCITDGRDYSINELINSICHALRTNWIPMHVPDSIAYLFGTFGDKLKRLHMPFPIDSNRVRKLSKPLTFSCEKANKVLGYQPVETLEEGILREVEWLKITHGSK